MENLMNKQTGPAEMPYLINRLKVGFSFVRNFTYIIIDKNTRQAGIVDPAWELDTIVETLGSLDAELTAILLTHSHFDHVNLVRPLLKRFRAEVYMSRQEIEFYKYSCKHLNATQHLDPIAVGQTAVSCLFTPGHTAGSTCFLLPDSLFTGDTVFTEGCGMCHTHGACPEKMFSSIQEIKKAVPQHVRIYPGHSFGMEPGQTLRRLMKENIYFQIEEKAKFVDFRMRKNFTNFFDFH